MASVPTIAAWSEVAGSDYYRCIVPLRGIQRLGLARSLGCALPPTPHSLPAGDIVLGHALRSPFAAEQWAAQAEGCLRVADTDDDWPNFASSTIPPWELTAVGALPRPPSAGETMWGYQEAMILAGFDALWPVTSRRRGEIRDQIERWQRIQQETWTALGDALVRSYQIILSGQDRAAVERHLRTLANASAYRTILRTADLVTVATQELAGIVEAENPHVCVLPNCLDLKLPAYQRREQRPGSARRVTIGWAGTLFHPDDAQLLQEILAALLREYDGCAGRPRVEIVLGGLLEQIAPVLRALPGGADFADSLERLPEAFLPRQRGVQTFVSAGGRGPYCYRTWTLDPESVPGLYATIDIGIIPRALGVASNAAKSDLKALEMGAMSIPCVVSPLPAYRETRGQDGTGAIVLPDNAITSWLAALRRLIEDPGLRLQMGREAWAYAQTRSTEVWAPRRMEVYEEAARRAGKTWTGRRAVPHGPRAGPPPRQPPSGALRPAPPVPDLSSLRDADAWMSLCSWEVIKAHLAQIALPTAPGVQSLYLSDDGAMALDIIVYNDDAGVLRGVFFYAPSDSPPYFLRGQVLVCVDPAHRRRGIASALWLRADQRWRVNPTEQKYTREGWAFAQDFLHRYPR